MRRTIWRALLATALVWASSVPSALADETGCSKRVCPDVGTGPGVLTASYVAETPAGWLASNEAPASQPYAYRLSSPCAVDTDAGDACRPDDDALCPSPPDRIVQVMVVEQRLLVLPGGSTIDPSFDPEGAAPGTAVGPWLSLVRACVDITALNPPPSPAEVFRYFQTLPLPELTTQQQPPGDGLVGLAVIFYTQSPTTQTFTVDIRGFTVDIVAAAIQFTWHTGDGTDLTSTDPGAPYPDQTVTHDYSSGTYTAFLTTTWGATFSVDGGASTPVPGTTTTDGPPVTFAVLQARPVLTNPYD
jgi:hypothetical protein